MLQDNKGRIQIEKSLHMEDAVVSFVGYASSKRPAIIESVSSKGKVLIRSSEDNGRTWKIKEEWKSEESLPNGRVAKQWPPSYYLDPDNHILVEFTARYEEPSKEYVMTFGPEVESAPLPMLTTKIYYRFSRDEGRTWEPQRQLIQKGQEYNAVHWANGVYYGKNSAFPWPLHNIVKLPDGTLVHPICVWTLGPDGKLVTFPDRFGSLAWPTCSMSCLLGRWREDSGDIDWEISNLITVPEYMSFRLDEAAVARLDDGTLLMVIRGDAGGRQAFPGVKFFSISKDGGRTWGPAVPLTYPDGSLVNSPASLPDLFRSSKNGRVYLVANILPNPTRQSDPRYPLQIAEVDQKYFWVLPDRITVIEDRQPHHPKFVRFSNWARMEDRETGNFVLYMTESRIDSLFDDIFCGGAISPHAFRYEIHLPG